MAYLDDHPPAIRQWYAKRNRPLTGCTVLHTAEGVLDTIGPDTGAEATADFIRRRTTAGSYHDLVDSDSWIPLVDLSHGAFHDGTGSNNWALSISFACRTTDWRAMSPAKREGFLRQGARAFAAQQRWRKSHGYPLTEIRLITKAQSDAGASGFTYHGYRDPSRRSDPGTTAAASFPFDEFARYCREELADSTPTASHPGVQEDDMPTAIVQPGENVTLPSPYGDTDLRVACDNPAGRTVDIDGKTVLIEGVALRIAVQNPAAPPSWRPVGGNFPRTGDPFQTNVPLGATGQHLGPCYAVSVTNQGHIPVTAVLAPHQG